MLFTPFLQRSQIVPKDGIRDFEGSFVQLHQNPELVAMWQRFDQLLGLLDLVAAGQELHHFPVKAHFLFPLAVVLSPDALLLVFVNDLAAESHDFLLFPCVIIYANLELLHSLFAFL